MSVDKDALVYICNMEWCDTGFHVEEPEEFQSFLFEGDVDEFSGDSCYCFPLSEGEIVTAYRMPCQTWYVSKPRRMTYEEVAKEHGFS